MIPATEGLITKEEELTLKVKLHRITDKTRSGMPLSNTLHRK